MAKHKYPEHERLKAYKGEAAVVQRFIDWLFDEKHPDAVKIRGKDAFPKTLELSFYPTVTEKQSITPIGYTHKDLSPNEFYESGALFPWRESREKMMARFFDIDLKKIEDEKRQMLDELREHNEKVDASRE